MKITNFELINIYNQLDSFASKRLPQRISYAITKNLLLLNKDVECYNTELAKLFKKYEDKSLKDDEGQIQYNKFGIPIIQEKFSKEFDNELNELLNIEIEVELYAINDALFDYDDLNDKYDALSPGDMFKLQKILCEEK